MRDTAKQSASVSNSSQPKDILSAWYALEVLSPQTFKKPEDFVTQDSQVILSLASEKLLPWEKQNRMLPVEGTFYHILLGSLSMKPINELLLKKFGNDFEEKIQPKQKAALAFITVDRYGRMVGGQDNIPIAISSFAWGYPQVLKDNLKNLTEWEVAESKLKSDIFEIFFSLNANGERVPITQDQVSSCFKYLIEKLEISEEHLERTVYLIQKYQPPPKKKNDQIGETKQEEDQKYPDPPLLNSFYLKDIQKAKSLFLDSEQEPGEALSLYMGHKNPEKRIDVLQEPKCLESLLSLKSFHNFAENKEYNFFLEILKDIDDFTENKQDDSFLKTVFSPVPLGRWPILGGHSLVLLQQAAVNASTEELKNTGLIGINGPPGTGKTTLLRDMIVSVLVNRAQAMVKFEDPEESFSNKGKISVGESFIHVYEVNNSLKGFEMLVASSNNKAVENITKELPLLTSININPELKMPRYFKTTSDALSKKGEKTWGLIAAVMGNSQNQKAFREVFWHNDIGLHSYLKAATGQEVFYEEKCQKTGRVTRRTPQINIDQPPPRNKEDALKRWKKARERFDEALKPVEFLYQTIADGHVAECSFNTDQDLIERIEAHENLNKEINKLEEDCLSKQLEIEQNTEQMAIIQKDISAHKASAPNLTERFFGSAYKVLKEKRNHCQAYRDKLESELKILEKELNKKKKEYRKSDDEMKRIENGLNIAKEHIERAKEIAEGHYGDSNFWNRPKDALHKSTIWFSRDAQEYRDEVFAAAMEVHLAFIDVAAKPIRHNLMAYFYLERGRSLPLELREFIADMWSTLFMVVPVISTTFASIGSMLKWIGFERLGWLFVDEAGQATPQAAVGALMRSKRVVMMGDPLQIEPVVSLSNNLIRSLCKEFDVDPDLWAAPFVSAQGCADRGSCYGTQIPRENGNLWIGFPLLVHRRCENPMFNIANEIAYNNLMIYDTPSRSSKIRDVLGESKWFDLVGTAQDKWCVEEGELVVELLKKLVEGGLYDPNIYLITPFRDIAYNMKRRLTKEERLFEKAKKGIQQWLNDHVGTVHTFQGKEAEAVFMILGMQSKAQQGARLWAGSQPNLLNVAVTRAKSAFYVIGNHALWSSCGTFQTLSNALPVENYTEHYPFFLKDKVA